MRLILHGSRTVATSTEYEEKPRFSIWGSVLYLNRKPVVLISRVYEWNTDFTVEQADTIRCD